MLYELDGVDPLTALSVYLNARTKSGNWRGKKLLGDSARLEELESSFRLKVTSATEALQLGVAAIRVDDSCDPGMLSVRFRAGAPVHIPASSIPDDLHARIVKELSDGASGNWKVA